MKTRILLGCVWAVGLGMMTNALFAASQLDIVGPPGSDSFGNRITVLPNGNFVVTDPSFDQINPPVTDVGAVYLFSPDGVLISSITGSQGSDNVGNFGITVLANGNFVVLSLTWNNGAASIAGAVTWGSAETGFIGGPHTMVSAANSLVGGSNFDQIGSDGLRPLNNGNYVVMSPFWKNGGASSAGAVTWGNGTTGTVGVVSAANSLVGSQANDSVGFGFVTALSNGNYVVSSPNWNNGGTMNAGAATWGNGATGIKGVVSAANSLVGIQNNDRVGSGVTALSNGNYVVSSLFWDDGGITDVGAVTWGNGATGITGPVSAANSLVGSQSADLVGSGGVTALANGNYVVSSRDWANGGATDAGAATWGNGATGIVGQVTVANSLVGSQPNDSVGFGGATALSNGNYVVRSFLWDNGVIVDAGAATWGNGATGIVGLVSAANSLVGSSANDRVGNGGVTALSNSNYVVRSRDWDNGGAMDAGAATWGNGSTGIVGLVSAANSLVGSQTNDQISNFGITALANGNYVVRSASWANGGIANAGAATWGNGRTGVRGLVSAANSLVGGNAFDQVGSSGVTALNSGNYVVTSSLWDNGGAANAGAVTWGSGRTGVRGLVSPANSLVGGSFNDRVGNEGITALANGNYVVRSEDWDNGGIVDAGAVTFGDGRRGVRGLVSAANSLVGGSFNDNIGDDGVTGLSNGHYVVHSAAWDNLLPAVNNSGAVTLGDGENGTVGLINRAHSVLGMAANFGGSMPFDYDPLHEQLIVGRPLENIVTLLGNRHARSLAKTAATAPGAADLSYARPGEVAVNAVGAALAEFVLTGTGAARGRNRALFGTGPLGGPLGLVLRRGDEVSSLGGGLPPNATANAILSPVTQQLGRGLFQATVRGSGINGLNNRLLLADNGVGVWLVQRSGQAIPQLGGAAVRAYREVLQNYGTQDAIAVSYQLRPLAALGVNRGNDTGIIMLKHSGAVIGNSAVAREGAPAFGGLGVFGQFFGRAALGGSDDVHFGALLKFGSSSAQAVFSMEENGSGGDLVALAGSAAPGAAPGVFSSFPAVGSPGGVALFKAFLRGVPSSVNEGLWRGRNVVALQAREGDAVTGLPGVLISRIVRFWPVGGDQVVLQVLLRGSGVNRGNNQALLLRQADGNHLVLARTGDSPAGIGGAALRSFAAVDVNPESGRYVLLTTLKSSPGSRNLALWTGDTSLGNDTTQQALRLPTLRMRKGDTYSTPQTVLNTVRSLSLRLPVERSGASGRGLAHAIGAGGDVAVFITGDRRATELVLLPGN